MKLLKWFFNFRQKYYKDQRKYQKGGLSTKIVTLVFMVLAVAACLVCQYFAMKAFKSEFLVGLLLVMLEIGLVATTFQENTFHAIIAFNNIINEKLESKIVGELDKRLEIKDGEIVAREQKLTDEELEELNNNRKVRKSYKGMDIAVGVVGILSVIALIGGIPALFLL